MSYIDSSFSGLCLIVSADLKAVKERARERETERKKTRCRGRLLGSEGKKINDCESVNRKMSLQDSISSTSYAHIFRTKVHSKPKCN